MELAKMCCACVVMAAWVGAAPARVVFPDERARQEKKLHEPITPPVLPVIAHLENDPKALAADNKVASRNAKPAPDSSTDLKPRFGINHGFDVSPNSDGGLTATFSNGYSGFGGNSQSAAHSLSFGFNKGFQASQSASSSSSFNNPGFGSSSFSGSQASSQASSFSAGFGGISSSAAAASSAASAGNGQASANSQSAGFGASFGTNGENSVSGSQSASSTFNSGGSGNSFSNAAGSAFSGSNFGSRPSGNNYSGRPSGNSYSGNRPSNSYSGNRPGNSFSGSSGNSYSGNRPTGNNYSGSSGNSNFGSGSENSNFGEGSIDIRNRNNGARGVATSIVFPGESSRGRIDIDGTHEIVTFNDDRWLRGSTSYRSKSDGGLGDWLSILVSD